MSTLTRHVVLKLALFGLVVIAPQITRAECECQPGSVEEAIRNADRIFRAEVISARISEDDSEIIDLVVKVDDAIRGNTEKRYQLTTAMPDSCGVSVLLGFHDMYVLAPGETSVSSCTGSGRATYMKYPLLATAIALVDLPVSDVRGAQQLLSKKFYSSYDRATVDEFFELVERIDSTGNMSTGMADRIEYRGIAVYFKDGKYEKVGAL
ncbi:MAG: hypothetical protein OES10_01725 [Gammaproteobacteria bacterium]|nr:hypothetical protein [Gammaproteobacteria bacterium]MDH3750787.1 hypothetical protein [Gammaproteobacteria bacterium]